MSTRLHSVTKSFGDLHALQNINLEVKEGEFVAIVGPSGCGKSTLLRLLAGFDRPTHGEITIGETMAANASEALPPEKRSIGMVFQSFALWPHMKVHEQIMFPLQHRSSKKMSKSDKQKRVEDVLSLTGMTEFADRMPHQLSGGQKQRVALARAIVASPSLLLMDEPLSSLDAELRSAMRQEIQRIHKHSGATIVYVTHDQEEALAMADRIVVMQNGQIEQAGTPRGIYYYPATAFAATFVSKANIIPGVWNHSTFHPFNQSHTFWEKPKVAPFFQKKSIFPARPDELILIGEVQKDGLQGMIKNVQFQGTYIQYTVSVEETDLTVHADILQNFAPGDTVTLQLKESSIKGIGLKQA
ncbi:ABC transporter ATP-binding protein [Sinobaca sp. H24]|uniref:ABC transporter ATP-binding protein n=1 Tax=Sinobaca sp. H24 TaxID=2923376 RepID=UPI00207ADE9A|nr:ABC transporter ATP-binding protein [Sinobaca sp. H24]